MLSVALIQRRAEFLLDAKFDVATPGVIALFGRSGCGKTTLVNLIAGLLNPDSGRIQLDGETLLDTTRALNVPAERRRIGYVFQDARLFPHIDVRGNLLYGFKRRRGATRISFDEVVNLLGLETLLPRRSHQLSGGERQRVALGRALLAQPRLLLLDEPLAALDLARREEVLPYLERLRDTLSLPMIYVSHQFDEVLRLASQVVLLENGRSLGAGGVGEISLHPRLREIVGPDSLGAVVEGEVVESHAAGLTRVQIGRSLLQVETAAKVGTRLRVQLLARDLILATSPPRNLSVRNVLTGAIQAIVPDDSHSDLVHIDLGGATVFARITHAATQELNLRGGQSLWILVKSMSIRGHLYSLSP